ncbi:MAG: NADH-quinone oxidoreductase subunit N [Rhodothermales bacterium]|nr:NADH-quinone oxidoreductase subunit N [Rhodothermales bacterium]
MDLSTAYDALGADLQATLSLWLIVLGGLIVIVWDAFRERDALIPVFAGLILVGAIVWDLFQLTAEPATAFYGLIRTGGFAAFVNLLLEVSALCTIVLSVPYLKRIGKDYAEVYGLVLFAVSGMMLLGAANNLVTIFVGLETMSICLYIMAGLVREDEGGIESALKYFLLGAFSTGFFLYGIALLFGSTGSMYLAEIGHAASTSTSAMYWSGVGLLLVGFLFKVSAVPFHMWTPDVYQGAPTTLTGFMSTASKAAAFASLILVLFYAVPYEKWTLAVAVIATITMVLGNLVALSQRNVKRMLAYSSIAHAGYVLVGIVAGSAEGYAGALYYLLVYTLMNIGAFGVLALMEWDNESGRTQSLDSLAGMGYTRPFIGVAMGVFMFSLSGFPPFGGFLGKYAVFAPAIKAGYTWLVVVGVIASMVSAYYYLRVLYVLWMKDSTDPAAMSNDKRVALTVPASSTAVIGFCAVLLLVFGVYPEFLQMAVDFFSPSAVSIAP